MRKIVVFSFFIFFIFYANSSAITLYKSVSQNYLGQNTIYDYNFDNRINGFDFAYIKSGIAVSGCPYTSTEALVHKSATSTWFSTDQHFYSDEAWVLKSNHNGITTGSATDTRIFVSVPYGKDFECNSWDDTNCNARTIEESLDYYPAGTYYINIKTFQSNTPKYYTEPACNDDLKIVFENKGRDFGEPNSLNTIIPNCQQYQRVTLGCSSPSGIEYLGGMINSKPWDTSKKAYMEACITNSNGIATLHWLVNLEQAEEKRTQTGDYALRGLGLSHLRTFNNCNPYDGVIPHNCTEFTTCQHNGTCPCLSGCKTEGIADRSIGWVSDVNGDGVILDYGKDDLTLDEEFPLYTFQDRNTCTAMDNYDQNLCDSMQTYCHSKTYDCIYSMDNVSLSGGGNLDSLWQCELGNLLDPNGNMKYTKIPLNRFGGKDIYIYFQEKNGNNALCTAADYGYSETCGWVGSNKEYHGRIKITLPIM